MTEYNECSNFLLIRNDRDKQRPSARNALRLCDSKPQGRKLHLNREDAKLSAPAVLSVQNNSIPAKAGIHFINRRGAEDAEFLNHNDHYHQKFFTDLSSKSRYYSTSIYPLEVIT